MNVMKYIWINIEICRARNSDKARTHAASIKLFVYLKRKLKRKGATLDFRMKTEYRVQSTLLHMMMKNQVRA
jgi:hypothetical protein